MRPSLLVLALSFCVLPARAQVSEDLAEAYLDATGLDDQAEQIAGQLQQQMQMQAMQMPEPLQEPFAESLARALSAEAVMERLEAYVAANAEEAALRGVIERYEDPTVQRLQALQDSASTDPNAQVALQMYAMSGQFNSFEVTTEREAQIDRYMEVTGAQDAAVDLYLELVVASAVFNADLCGVESPPADSVRARARPQLEGMIGSAARGTPLYAFRELSDEEVEAFIVASDTEAARYGSRLGMGALSAALADGIREGGAEFVEAARAADAAGEVDLSATLCEGAGGEDETEDEGIGAFRDGVAWATQEGEQVRIDREGRLLPAPRFDAVGPRTEGSDLVWVKKNGAYGIYNEAAGEVVVEPAFLGIALDDVEEERPLIRAQAGTGQEPGFWGYVEPSGAWAIPPAFAAAGPFEDGTALVLLADATAPRWGAESVPPRLARIDPAGRVLDRPLLEPLASVAAPPLVFPDSLFDPPKRPWRTFLRRFAAARAGAPLSETQLGVRSERGAPRNGGEGFRLARVAFYPGGERFFGDYGYESVDEALDLPGLDYEEVLPRVRALAGRLFEGEVEERPDGGGVWFQDPTATYYVIGLWPLEGGVRLRIAFGT